MAAVLETYQDKQADDDFDFFLDNYDAIYKEYGKCFIAIRNKHILGTFSTVREGVDALAPDYPQGSYILQECDGTPAAYTTSIMGVKINE